MTAIEPITPRASRWLWLAPFVVLVWLLLTPAGRGEGAAFLAKLRMARPAGVSVSIPAFAGPTGTRRVADAVAAMVADSVHSAREARDTAVADVASAARAAGFTPHLPAARRDTPIVRLETMRSVSMNIDRAQLRTMLTEAGHPPGALPASLHGSTLTIETPAAVRAQYGHCPEAVSTSLQNQIIGQPPPTTASTDCIVLTERPIASAVVPPGLDMRQLVELSLEVAGMSPRQAADFQHSFDWPVALTLSLPRFMRSSDTLHVDGAPGLLVNLGGRRGPTYELIWAKDGMVYSLEGYGSTADGLSTARSVR